MGQKPAAIFWTRCIDDIKIHLSIGKLLPSRKQTRPTTNMHKTFQVLDVLV